MNSLKPIPAVGALALLGLAALAIGGVSAIGSQRRAGRGSCAIQAWRPLRFPHHRRRYGFPGRQRRPRGGESAGQGPRNVLGRCGTFAEAAGACGVAYHRQGHRSRPGGVAREQSGSGCVQAISDRSSRDHRPDRRTSLRLERRPYSDGLRDQPWRADHDD
jgi:hypothetical protein